MDVELVTMWILTFNTESGSPTLVPSRGISKDIVHYRNLREFLLDLEHGGRKNLS